MSEYKLTVSMTFINRSSQTDWQAQRLNAPLFAFATSKHEGTLGRVFSLLKVSNPRIRVLAVKKAELSDDVIVRLVELDGKPQSNVKLSFAAPIASAREVKGQEQPVGEAVWRKARLLPPLVDISRVRLRYG